MPFYISCGPNYNKFSGSAYPVKFDFKFFMEGGVLLQYIFLQTYPFYTGIEYQRRGYDYNIDKKGIANDGRNYEKKVNGFVRIDYLNIPILFKIPARKPSEKFHILAGAGLSFRLNYYEEYEGTYSIPKDTLVIPLSYQNSGNDALDFMDFNVSLGCRYGITKKLDVWALVTRKLFGISTGKENFITANEINTNFTIKLVYRLPSWFHIPI